MRIYPTAHSRQSLSYVQKTSASLPEKNVHNIQVSEPWLYPVFTSDCFVCVCCAQPPLLKSESMFEECYYLGPRSVVLFLSWIVETIIVCIWILVLELPCAYASFRPPSKVTLLPLTDGLVQLQTLHALAVL